jgi:hypothetical protein
MTKTGYAKILIERDGVLSAGNVTIRKTLAEPVYLHGRTING